MGNISTVGMEQSRQNVYCGSFTAAVAAYYPADLLWDC